MLDIKKATVAAAPDELAMLQDTELMAALAPHATELEVRDMGYSQLQACHLRGVCQLSRLQCLRVSRIRDGCMVPPELGQLRCLKDLQLSPTGRMEGPDPGPLPLMTVCTELSQLQALTSLILHNAQDCLPSVCHLTALRELALEYGGAPHSVPSHVADLRRLTSVCLSYMKLEGDLHALSALTSLRDLLIDEVILGDAPGARAGWVHALDCLTSLVELRIEASAANVAPGCLSRLTRLERLTLSCELTSFQCSSSWQRLQLLCLPFNMLTTLPDMVSALTCLTELRVSSQQGPAFQLRGPLLYLQHMPSLRWLELRQLELTSDGQKHAWSPGSLGFLAEAEAMLSSLRRGKTMQQVLYF